MATTAELSTNRGTISLHPISLGVQANGTASLDNMRMGNVLFLPLAKSATTQN